MTDIFNPDEYYKEGDNDFGKGGYSLLENGVYLMIITQAEMKPTNAGTGTYLKMTFQVCDGQKKTCVFQMFNISNPKPTCVAIGRKQLAGLTKALGLSTIDLNNPKVFEGHKVLAEVYIRKGKGEYNGKPNPDTNEISAYKNKDEKAAAPQPSQTGNFTDTDGTPF
jgi:hypothetical protein